MKIKKLRLYKPDGEFLEFEVGLKYTDMGKCKLIHNETTSAITGIGIFRISFEKGEVVASGFPFTLQRK